MRLEVKPTVRLRTWFVLGRASNLPTVWSNCLAGWWLGGGGSAVDFVVLCLGVTCLYTGGMYLNDAFDIDFDRQHRTDRPIPSGAISAEAVWLWGFGWLGMGLLVLAGIGLGPAVLGIGLAGCIVMYDAVHKAITFSPVLMGGCRFLVYLVAAAAGEWGITGLAIWSGLALGFYIVGVSYLARKESLRGSTDYWPCYFLAVPFGLALLVNTGLFRARALVIGFIFLVWSWRSVRPIFGVREHRIGWTVSNLLAGIVWVDWLAVADAPGSWRLAFVVLFFLALLFQRFIPAT